MNDSFQYGDIVFLGIVAVFLLLRLRSMLGRDSGIDPREVWKNATRNINPEAQDIFSGQPHGKQGEEELVPPHLQDNKAIADGLKAIRDADKSFSTSDFLAGAKVAFEWVVEAFSRGDKEKLRAVLSEERFKRFAEDIDMRISSNSRRETTLVSIAAADITEATIKGNIANITIQFTTEQINVMRDKDNKVVGGDPSTIEKAIDIWTFERDVTSRDPNWKIVAT
ncbi:MAG TPA: Tim44/TimA family putative adaptor protein [Rickettsiales bacterium]|nr:Tim44/TimA family putative adaptor protein [Rickettsiales bacterium]